MQSIFKAYDIRGKVGTELTPDLAKRVGRALADWLPTSGAVVVGRDMRPDSADLATALTDGLRLQGREVIDIGEVTTDMMYFAVGRLGLAGGAVVTASHNGGEYNGIKIYRDGVTPVGLDGGLDEIRDLALANDFVPATKEGALTHTDISRDWVTHALNFVDSIHWPRMKVAIDAGNGMAGAILPKILPVLPLDVTALYFDLDGTFPNHEANPQNPDNLTDLIKAVKEKNCEFGIAFDGDGDRAALVDDLGKPVLGTDMITLIAHAYLRKYPHAEIIHDVRTSRATIEWIRQWGGKPVRAKAGRVSIGRVLRERGAPFGGETTGHLFFADNYDADSGLIAALMAIQAIVLEGKKLSEIIDEYRTYEMISETNFTVQSPGEALKALAEAFNDGEQDWLDGLTVNYAHAWFNMRASNTEPLIRLNAEAKTKKELNELVDRIQKVLQ
ncbi:MAG TPA: phosphomannomutase/phosphoglucomutase [Candidatus Saccharimonadales bacterium]|nr:phosphomannomutase/phosphoglucomutase [Candidatus Saccharimonadales bacterium]